MVTRAPGIELAHEAFRQSWIAKRPGPNRDERRTRDEILEHRVCTADAPDADDRDRGRLPHFPRRQNAYRKQPRSAPAAGAVAERRTSALDVDREAGDRIHDADGVGTGVGGNA